MPTFAPRETFDRELKHLQNNVVLLGSMVEQAVREAMTALRQRDVQLAEQVYRGDALINQQRYAIENECLTLIATQQPMARDLRILAAVLEIITELERIGDYAKGIARIAVLLDQPPQAPLSANLERMAERGLLMLDQALTAFVNRDATRAREIPELDDEVDALYNRIYNELIRMIIANPPITEQANHIMWAAHNLERLADRVTNICERILFVITGELREFDVTDDESVFRS